MRNKYFQISAIVTAVSLLSSYHTSFGQNKITIGSGMQVVSGSIQVSIGAGEFVNNGSYTDTTGTFNMLGGVMVSGTGTTTLNNLNLSHASESSVFNSLVSVEETTNLMAGDLDANNNLFLRSDYSPNANMMVSGVLMGTVQGLVTNASVSVGACPSYTSDLSLNVSGPAMNYQWQSSLDGTMWTDVAGATNEVYTATVGTDIYYRCDLTTNNSTYHEATPSVQLLLTGVPDAVTVTGAGPHCVETVIMASGGSGGSIYYQGMNSGGTSTDIQADTALITGSGTYYFRSRSVAGCWGVQDSVDVIINPLVTPLVTLANSGGLHLCSGNATDFATVIEHGGATPGYEWFVNNVSVSTSGNSFSYIPRDGDEVKVVLTSSAPCPTTPTVNAIATMKVDSNFIPVAEIRASPAAAIDEGQMVTLTVSVKNAGATPSFQWIKNGVAINGATTSVYASDKFVDKDSVTCMVVGSGICAWPSFNSVVLSVNSAGVKDLASGGHIGIMPNPNNGAFAVKGVLLNTALDAATLEVTNMLGQLVYSKEVKISSGQIDAHVVMGSVARGSYILSLKAGGERAAFHIVVDR